MTSCEGCGSDDGPGDDWEHRSFYPYIRPYWKCPDCKWCWKCGGRGEIKELMGATEFYTGPCEICDGNGVLSQ